MLKGLQYVGNGRGMSVMLYKSYKSVDVTWDKPYTFTSRDIVNDDAKKYYSKNYSPLGIRVIEDNTTLPELDTGNKKVSEVEKTEVVEATVVNEEPIAEVEATEEVGVAEVASEEVKESGVAEVESDLVYPVLVDIFKSIKAEYDVETISSISESDLASLLDERLDDDRVKELATWVGYSIGRTKNKYKIISGLTSSHLETVVNLILA